MFKWFVIMEVLRLPWLSYDYYDFAYQIKLKEVSKSHSCHLNICNCHWFYTTRELSRFEIEILCSLKQTTIYISTFVTVTCCL